MPIRLCALMSFGDALRISRNRAMPGSICWRRINDSASSYEAGAGGDCAATENSGVSVSAMMKKVLKKRDLKGLEYNSLPGKAILNVAQARENTEQTEITEQTEAHLVLSVCSVISVCSVFSYSSLCQNSIFNPN